MTDAASGVPLVAFLPSAWKPRHRDDLVRLGSDFDGGYVVTENIIGHTDFLIGLGVGTDWTFEEDIYKRKGCPVHCYDHSVGVGQFTINTIRSAKVILASPRIDHLRRISLSKILRPIKFRAFFSGNKKHFKEKIGDDTENSADFKKIFSRIPPTARVFIKMDIEGWEYNALGGLGDYCERVTGLAVEFHQVCYSLDEVRGHINNLEKFFNIVHVHVNNSGVTDERGIPELIEMTFESKTLSNFKESESQRKYPIDGIDLPNAVNNRDYKLEFRD